MQQSVIAILILGTALVLYMIPKIPLTVTTMLAVLAMVFTGVLSVEQAFSGFSNNTTLFVAGMLIIGQACFTTGLVKKMSTVLCRFVGVSEKTLAMVIFILSAVLGVFLNGAIIVSLLMTAIDCIAANSNGKYQRKNLYFPLGMGATVGNNMTTISGTSTITALAIYYAVGYETVPLFEPLLVNLPAFIVALLFFFLNGYRLSVKTFDFEDENAAQQTVKNDKAEYITWKIVLTSIVLVMVIVALIAGCNYGVCSVLGAAVLILTGCIGEKETIFYKGIMPSERI